MNFFLFLIILILVVKIDIILSLKSQKIKITKSRLSEPTPTEKQLLLIRGFVRDATNNLPLVDSELSDVKITLKNIDYQKSNSTASREQTPQGSSNPFIEGQWILLKHRELCVKHTGTNGRVSQAPCQNQPNFLWMFTKNNDGTYFIKSKVGNQVLDVAAASKRNLAAILAYSLHGGPNQKWTVLPYSQPNQYLIKSLKSGKCMDDTGKYGEGNLFHQYDCSTENVSQPFTFVLPPNDDQSTNSSKYNNGVKVVEANNAEKTYNATIQNSIYSVSLPAGKYELTISSNVFIESTTYVEFTKSSDENNLQNTILLSYKLKGWRFVLTWGAVPKDFDLIATTSKKEMIYYGNKLSADGNISLDNDARDGFGPETMTVKEVKTEKIYIYAKNYSNDALISESKGKVAIYKNSRVVSVVEVPKGEVDSNKDIWFVGTLDENNKFTLVNTIVDEILA